MPTQDLTGGGTAPKHTGTLKRFLLENTIDFATDNGASADVIQALNIPAGTLVERVGVEVITAEGGTATADIGDESTTNGYGAGFNLNATAGTIAISALALTEATPNTVTGYTNGKLYTAADTIDLVLNHALDAAKIRVFAICTDLNG